MQDISREDASISRFPEGFGKFPYIILNTGYGVLIQIPIQINPPSNDLSTYPGTHLRDVDPILIEEYAKNKNSGLHDLLLNQTQKVKEKIESDKKIQVRICLVEGEKIAYYFEGDQIKFNSNIPHGGTLVTQTQQIIGMGISHFIPHQSESSQRV
jgi:hypothetical protein